MDGTTPGTLGSNLPTPQPTTPPAQSADGLLQSAPVPVQSVSATPPASPVAPPPIVQPQPQYSQLTPVYAPTPTNTPADIPQPAVKGIEFVQPAAALIQPAPPVEPVAVSPAIMPPPVATPLPTTVPPLQSPQLIQPVLPPPPATTSPPTVTPPLPPAIDTLATSSANYTNIENQIEDVDLDQMVGAVPASNVTQQAVPAPQPVAPATSTPAAAANTYFQSKGQIVSDVPITDTKSGRNIDPKLIRRVAIIAGSIIILGVISYFVITAIAGNNKEPVAPATDTTQTPDIAEPDFTPDDTETPVVTEDPVTPDDSAVVPDPTPPPTTTEEPEVTEPVVPEEPTTTEDPVPSVANSGVQ